MIPIVDARSGKFVKVGETYWYPPTRLRDGTLERAGFVLETVTRIGLRSVTARVRIYEGPRKYVISVKAPIKY